jgi:hypothetical protein
MNLQELNNIIHSATKEDLQDNLNSWKDSIKALLIAGTEADDHYYRNHTGRELFRKLYNFGMTTELGDIGDEYDSGFRPITTTGIKS